MRSATVIAPGAVGNVSVKVAPVNATGLLFANMICSVETPVVGRIGLVRKDLVMVGGASTVMVALVAVPFDAAAGPVTVKFPAAMVLVLIPMLVPVTVAVTVHEPLAGIPPPVSETVEPLAALVPVQVPPGTEAVKPDGKASVNAAPVIAVPVGLLNVIVSVAVPFSGTVAALKALAMFGRATFKVALAAKTLLPMLEFTPPAGMVLV